MATCRWCRSRAFADCTARPANDKNPPCPGGFFHGRPAASPARAVRRQRAAAAHGAQAPGRGFGFRALIGHHAHAKALRHVQHGGDDDGVLWRVEQGAHDALHELARRDVDVQVEPRVGLCLSLIHI